MYGYHSKLFRAQQIHFPASSKAYQRGKTWGRRSCGKIARKRRTGEALDSACKIQFRLLVELSLTRSRESRFWTGNEALHLQRLAARKRSLTALRSIVKGSFHSLSNPKGSMDAVRGQIRRGPEISCTRPVGLAGILKG